MNTGENGVFFTSSGGDKIADDRKKSCAAVGARQERSIYVFIR